jgi:hypothetical protein
MKDLNPCSPFVVGIVNSTLFSQIQKIHKVSQSKQTKNKMNSNSKTNYVSVATEQEPPMIEFGDVRVIVDNKNNTNSPSYSQKDCHKVQQNTSLWSREPVDLAFCPHCAMEHIRTRTRTYPNFLTWTCVAVGAVVFFPICWVPLVVDNLKKTDHYCQNCGQKIGSIKPMENVCVKEQS